MAFVEQKVLGIMPQIRRVQQARGFGGDIDSSMIEPYYNADEQ